MIKTPCFATFDYPAQYVTLADYTVHKGQTVEVLRACFKSEADGPEVDCEQMYIIQAADGWQGQAFESELVVIDSPVV
jgi:hypothetical protein